MKIFALDTSTPRGALAVTAADGSVYVAATDPAQRHGRSLIPAVRDLLLEAGLSAGGPDLWAVGLGPGSYTGLRIGLTAAKVLAYASGQPLIGFDSLEAVAQNAPDDTERVAVIADAQRGDLYTADFLRERPGGPLVRVTPTRVEALADWLARLGGGTLVLGPGRERLRAELPPSVRTADPAADVPDGRRLVGLASEIWETGHRDDPYFLEPLYLRRSAAEDQWEKLGRVP